MIRTLALVVLLASSPALAQVFSFSASDPVAKPQLPPMIERVPEPGDRWVYSTPAPNWNALETVEVTALEPWGEGWRALVETSSIAYSEVSEWFFRPDGALLHGDQWRNGVLAFDVGAPTLVIAGNAKRKQEIRRRGVWYARAGSSIVWKPGMETELDVRHRARLRVAGFPGSAGELWPGPTRRLELAVRSRSYCRVIPSPFYSELERAVRRERLVAWYDDELGLVAWERSMERGCGYAPVTRVLLSAQVGGITFPAPEAP